MKLHLFLAAVTLGILLPPGNATTYSVKAGGGGNFATIQACATAMAAGDTCTVFAGTYNEAVTITAGTVGKYKTLNTNSGDTVNVHSFTLNSHTKIIGFTITNPSSPSSSACVSVASLATDIYITNNVMTQCGNGSTMINEQLSTTGTTFIYIQANTLSWGCSTPGAPNVCEGMLIDGNHHLIEGNDFSHVSDGVTLYGSNTVFRNNTMHDTSPSECGSHSSNCHIDFVESEPVTSVTSASFNNLYEGNYQTNNSGSNAHVFLTQGDSCGGNCKNTIIRYNHTYLLGTYWLLDNLGDYSHVKDYNNTIVCALNGSACTVSGVDSNVTGFQTSTNAAEVNNIYYNSLPNGSGAFYAGVAPFRHNNNLAFTSSCAPSCSYGSPFSSEIGRITNQDPKFVNPGADWHLQVGSPAIGAGSSLSTAVNSGSSSTSLTVADSDYFQDGLGLGAAGVQADWIRIGASTTVQISSVSYATNVITLTSAVSWSSGDPIYLYKNSSGTQVLFGASPDIGAFPSGSSQSQGPAPPAGLLAVVQ